MGMVGLVHTTRLVVEAVHKAVTDHCPGIEFNHVMDEGILRSLSAQGSITAEITQWLTNMVVSTQEIGADLAVVSCSSLSPCVNAVQERVSIPVLKIDEPMMEHAVRNAESIGLVMTNPTTEKPSTLLFDQVSKRLGRNVTLVPRLCPDAFANLTQGNISSHDKEVCDVVEALLAEVDVVMLAQISIARVREQLHPAFSGRIFSSLDFIGNKINEVLDKR